MTSPVLMQLVEDLEALVRGEHTVWGRVAGRRGLLSMGLRAAVAAVVEGDRSAADRLGHCRRLFADPSASAALAHFYELPEFGNLPVNTSRIHRNATALAASAQAWATACEPVSQKQRERLVEALKDTVRFLGGAEGEEAVAITEGSPGDAVELVASALGAMESAGWAVAGAGVWVRSWARESPFAAGGVRASHLRVPVAYVANPGTRGQLAQLHLWALPGRSELVEHPALATEALTVAFTTAMRRAWEQAEQSGCYDLSLGEAGTVLDGDSASGPAAVGWRALGRGEPYDPATVVVGRLQDGDLEVVAHELPKLRAAATAGIRRAVVPAGTTLSAAEREDLGEWGLDVVVLRPRESTVAGALEEVSGLGRQLRDYLEAMESQLRRPVPWHAPGVSFEALRQQVRVAPERLRGEGRAAEGREPEPWERARDEAAVSVVLGDPGYGKSWLLRQETLRLAAECRQALREGGPGAAVIPLGGRLAVVAALMANGLEPAHALVESARRSLSVNLEDILPLGDRLRDELVERIGHGRRVAVLLDGLDEVAAGRMRDAREVVGVLARSIRPPSRLVVTSRFAGYSPLLEHGAGREWELVALAEPDVTRLIAAWYPEGDPRRQVVEGARRRWPTLRAQTRIPLLAAFVCWVAEGGTLPPTRAGLYEQVLWKLLEGAWRRAEAAPLWTSDSSERVRGKLRVLEDLGYRALGRDVLDGDEVDAVVAAHPDTPRLERSADHPWGLVWELSVQDGILVPAGAAPPGWASGAVPFVFLHRTLGEYLSARAVARRDQAEVVASVREHAWADADWVEVIPLVVARLAETGRSPRPVLDELWRQVDRGGDAFHSVAALLARCLPEASDLDVHDLEAKVVTHLERVMGSVVDRDVRRGAFALAAIGSDRAAQVLIRRLGDADTKTRTTAAAALGHLGSESTVEKLVSLLDHEDAGMCALAASALGGIGSERAVEPLLHLLRDTDANVRCSAAKALGKLGSERAVEALLHLLRDKDADVRSRRHSGSRVDKLFGWTSRCTAAEALGEIGSHRAVEPLLDFLREKDPEVWRADLCSQVDEAVRRTARCRAAAKALGRIGSDRALEDLVALLDDPYVSSAAASALRGIGSDRAAEPLVSWLSDRYMRWPAMKALGKIGSDYALEPLLVLLNDKNGYVRWKATEALSEIRSDRALQPLLDLLRDDDARVRRASVGGLGKFGSDRVTEPMLGLLRDKDAQVRRATAAALGDIGSDRSVETLVDLLRDEDAEVRSTVAESLGKVGCDRATEPLIRIIYDDEADVRKSAAAALGEMRSDRAVDSLLDLLGDDVADVRESAARALGEIGSDRAVDSLLDLLGDDVADVRASAAQALGEIGSDRAVDSLLGVIFDREAISRAFSTSISASQDSLMQEVIRAIFVPGVAANALAKIGSGRAVRPLVATLERDGLAVHALERLAQDHPTFVLGEVLRRGLRLNIVRAYDLAASVVEDAAGPEGEKFRPFRSALHKLTLRVLHAGDLQEAPKRYRTYLPFRSR
jgi:HEAT repeat protein